MPIDIKRKKTGRQKQMRGLFLCCSRKDKQPKTCTHIGIQATSFPWQTSAVWKTNLSVRGLPADLENGHKETVR